MKTFSFFLILFVLFAGCKKQVKNEIIIKGHLDRKDVSEIFLKSDEFTFNAPVDSSGNFFLKFVRNQPGVYKLRFKDELNLFLIPGDSLIISREGDGYKFSGGQSALLSNYYLDWEKYWNKLGESFDGIKYFSHDPADFFKTVYAYIDSAEVPLTELSEKLNDINPEFLRLEKERLKYWMLIDFLPYQYELHRFYTGQEPIIDGSFLAYMKDVNLNDSSLLQLDSYNDFLITYTERTSVYKFQKNAGLSQDKYSETDFILNFILDEFRNEKVLDYVLYKVIYERTGDLAVNDKNLAAFKEHCRNKAYIDDVETKYKENLVLMPGNPAPEFALYDADNKEYKLSGYKGKYLFIDVWGVACNPCIREMPFLKQVEEDYKGRNIEFISVCFESNPVLWLKKIEELHLTGVQLIVKDKWDSQFRKDYHINWTPTYILIDKEGRFLDARAPKPSGNLRELIDKTCK
jgi:thiol-disulfide isomerase/thioredoxin